MQGNILMIAKVKKKAIDYMPLTVFANSSLFQRFTVYLEAI